MGLTQSTVLLKLPPPPFHLQAFQEGSHALLGQLSPCCPLDQAAPNYLVWGPSTHLSEASVALDQQSPRSPASCWGYPFLRVRPGKESSY